MLKVHKVCSAGDTALKLELWLLWIDLILHVSPGLVFFIFLPLAALPGPGMMGTSLDCLQQIIQYCIVMSSFAGEMSSLPNTATAMDNLCSHQMYIPNAAIGNNGLCVSTLTAALFLQGPGHG